MAIKFIDLCSDVRPLIRNKCEGVLKKIVDLALSQDPKDRPSAKELLNSGLFNDAEQQSPIPRLTCSKSYHYHHKEEDMSIKHMRRYSKPAMISPFQMKAYLTKKNHYISSHGCVSHSNIFIDY